MNGRFYKGTVAFWSIRFLRVYFVTFVTFFTR